MKSIHKERERIHDYEEKYYKEKKEILHVHRKNTLLCLMVFIGITLGSFFFNVFFHFLRAFLLFIFCKDSINNR